MFVPVPAPVDVPVPVPPLPTVIVPVIELCRSQKNVCVPSCVKVLWTVQLSVLGSGGLLDDSPWM